jgi:hypothetical protein
MTLWKRFVRVVYSDMTVLTWMLGWIAMALAFGFFVSGTDTGNYGLLNSTLPKSAWGVFFAGYGTILIISCLYYVEKWALGFAAMLGVWLWTYLFSSFAIFDPTPIASTEWMLTLPIAAQVWIFFSIMSDKKNNPGVCKVQNEEIELVALIRSIRHEIRSLNSDLILLNQENANLNKEVLVLSNEVSRIKSSMYSDDCHRTCPLKGN